MKKEKKNKLLGQYGVTVFLGFLTIGAFSLSIPAGMVLLLATLLACPATRNKIIALIEEKSGLALTRIKGWMYAAIIIVLVFAGVFMVPTSTEETPDDSMVAKIEEMSQAESTAIEETKVLEQTIEEIEKVKETESSIEITDSDKSIETTETQTSEIIEEQSIALVGEIENVEKEVTQDTINSDMEVHFIDVGQGDATLIKADGHYMLIDAGDNSKGTTVQMYLQKQGVTKLDYLILTHTDADHIGGADVIVTKFDIDTVFMGDFKKDNKTYEELMNAFQYKAMKYSVPKIGEQYTLGNALFTIVAPNKTYSTPNNSSIALLLKNGDNTFLFTGDCEEEAEKDILANGINIDCDVYHLGHHGSRTASTQEFLNAMTPVFGVISCEEGNSYGHPHAEPLNNLRAMGVQLFRTDEQGSVIAYSDGKEIKWNCAPSETWQAGESTKSNVSEQISQVQEAQVQEPQVQEQIQEPVIVPQNEMVVEPVIEVQENEYVIANKNSKVFHRPTCRSLPKEKNRVIYNSREEALAAGFDNPCDHCNP